MIDLKIETPGLPALAELYRRVPGIVREELAESTRDATDYARDVTRSLTPRSSVERVHTRDQVVSRAGTDSFHGRVVVWGERYQQIMRWLDEGTRPHEITPRFRKALRFVAGGRTVFSMRVQHPGTAALHIFERAREQSAAGVKRIYSNGVRRIKRRLQR